MMRVFNYDKDNDILSIHKGYGRDERFRGNLVAGDLIFDVSTKLNIVGLEIINARQVLKDWVRWLDYITDADFDAEVIHDNVELQLLITEKNRQVPAKIAVPLSS